MSYFPILILLPHDVAQKDDYEQYVYMTKILEKFNESTECPSYVCVTKDELESEYEENKDDYESLEEFCKKWYGSNIDKDGNGVSTFNKESLFTTWKIGGKFNKQIKNDDDFLIIEENMDSNNYNRLCTIKDNSVTTEVFLSKINQWKHHIVDHNGTLHKYIDQIPDSQWNNMVLSILSDCGDGLVVLLECEF